SARGRRPSSLRARSTLLMLGFALVPALALIVLLLDAYFDGARNRLQNNLGAVADALALASDARIQTQLRAVELTGGLAWSRLDAASAQERLRQMARGQPDVQVALAADVEGRIVALHREGADADALRGRIGASVADRPYFQQALRLRAPQVSDVFVGRGLWNEPVVALSAPVLDAGGEPLGVLQASIDLRLLGEQLALRLDRGRLGVLLDRQGMIVFASPELGLRPGESAAATAFAALVSAPDGADLIELEHAGHRYFARGRSNLAGWRAIALMPEETLRAVAKQAFAVVLPVL